MRLKNATYCDETCALFPAAGEKLQWCNVHISCVRPCENCGRMFHIHRAGVKTCGNRCRMALSRKKRSQSKA